MPTFTYEKEECKLGGRDHETEVSAGQIDNLPSLSMDRHQQLASWSQRDQRLRDHVGPRQEAQLIPGQDRRQDELRFGERKLIADTHARASPKGEVRTRLSFCMP